MGPVYKPQALWWEIILIGCVKEEDRGWVWRSIIVSLGWTERYPCDWQLHNSDFGRGNVLEGTQLKKQSVERSALKTHRDTLQGREHSSKTKGEQRQVHSLTKPGPPSTSASGHHCFWVSRLRLRPKCYPNRIFLVLQLQKAYHAHAHFLASSLVSQSLNTYLHVHMCTYMCVHVSTCVHVHPCVCIWVWGFLYVLVYIRMPVHMFLWKS